MFSALDHTTYTEETLVKHPSEDIQTSNKPIPKPRKAKRDETTRNKTVDEPKTKLSEIRTCTACKHFRYDRLTVNCRLLCLGMLSTVRLIFEEFNFI
jgi:hypothetical protein